MFIRCEDFHFSVSVKAFYFLFKILLQINFEINQCGINRHEISFNQTASSG